MQKTQNKAPSPKRLDLPFRRRRRDPVEVIYDHRAGIFSLLALALTMAILFVGSKIVIFTPAPSDAIVIDLKTVEELKEEQRRLQREVQMRQLGQADRVRNAVSSEGADYAEDSRIVSRVNGANEQMRGNRDAWEQGLREIEQMRGEKMAQGSKNSGTTARARGTVQVSYELINPLRNAVDLVNPGFRCERGGEVTVRIVVDRGGEVIDAQVDKSSSTNDACMHETALWAARRSRFDTNTAAPARHAGTITYIFISQ